uniref:Uncharacterized protein n=1 Tax=Vespula pensylvanica TaxID=30213 RepID=A0A834NXU8_VESPE|nr:hypothetical protein H0235_010855 [Vespula pensylvanica]
MAHRTTLRPWSINQAIGIADFFDTGTNSGHWCVIGGGSVTRREKTNYDDKDEKNVGYRRKGAQEGYVVVGRDEEEVEEEVEEEEEEGEEEEEEEKEEEEEVKGRGRLGWWCEGMAWLAQESTGCERRGS